jgi:dethiobiotin synthetase
LLLKLLSKGLIVKGLFVTGTDTGIGKTVVAAALLRYYLNAGACYWKPIQTGIEQDDDTARVQKLTECPATAIWAAGWRLELPLAPYWSAHYAGQIIDLQQLMQFLPTLETLELPFNPPNVAAELAVASPNLWIVEGAGGVYVPINETSLMLDLMEMLGLPVIIVARTTLGTINHTLLTINAVRQRQLPVAGVIMVGKPNNENRIAIEKFGRVRVLAEMPLIAPLNATTLQDWVTTHLELPADLIAKANY